MEVEVEVEAEVGVIGGGGDDGVEEVVASAVAVASARTRIHAKGLLRAKTLCFASVMWKEKNAGIDRVLHCLPLRTRGCA